jgi:hypothetical protein
MYGIVKHNFSFFGINYVFVALQFGWLLAILSLLKLCVAISWFDGTAMVLLS